MPSRLLSFEMPVIVGHLRIEHMDVSMAGDFEGTWGPAEFSLR
jgi:hypothetical protein